MKTINEIVEELQTKTGLGTSVCNTIAPVIQQMVDEALLTYPQPYNAKDDISELLAMQKDHIDRMEQYRKDDLVNGIMIALVNKYGDERKSKYLWQVAKEISEGTYE